ncbi:putative ribonuclease H protein [Senna tora]|uniref:Putative ribonuclease H protein n=1 Tax=Senna tora TaxID=362788 RepID=A0A834T4J0_9FABA|nr:putative ribonuclease H protein [Senna tora]
MGISLNASKFHPTAGLNSDRAIQSCRTYSFSAPMFSHTNCWRNKSTKGSRIIGIKELMEDFGRDSGLVMNPQKSEVKFSPSTPDMVKQRCGDLISCQLVASINKYLSSHIDSATRYTLIQSILATIPIYFLQFTKPTKKEASKCDQGIPMIAWDKVCCNKSQGVMGIRKFETLNCALLGKQY